MSYQSTVLADNPIRYYRLNESSGTVANDLGSQAQNGTLHGTITLGQTGLLTGDPATSMLFDGSTGYISLPTTSLPTGSAAWTLEAWAKTAGTIVQGMLVFFGTDAANEGAEIYDWTGATGWQADLDGPSLGSSGATAINTVYYIAGTYDGAKCALYVNGSLVLGPSTLTANIVQNIAYIGRSPSGFFWNSRMQEVAIYSSALSSSRITAHWNAGSTHLRILDGYGGIFS